VPATLRFVEKIDTHGSAVMLTGKLVEDHHLLVSLTYVEPE